MPQMSIGGLGSAVQATSGSSLSFNTLQTIYPGETAIHFLINNVAASSALIDSSGFQASPVLAAGFGTTHALVVYVITYPSGMASGSQVTWSGAGTYGVGCHALSWRIVGNTALQNYGTLAGTVTANGAYYAFNGANYSTGTRVRNNYRQTATWIALTAIKGNSPLNGLGQVGGGFAVQYNNGSNDVSAAALVWNQGPNQRPDTGIGLIQRHALAVPIVATYWRFVAP